MKKNPFLVLRIILGLGFVMLTILSVLQMIPPRPIPAGAPARQFSAARAMTDLAVVARQPHEAGSDAQALVRDYIVQQVQTVGLTAEIQKKDHLENILVRLPGTDPTLVTMITGHYDSNPFTPGAGDDGISTVAMLESIRALHAGTSLRNDVLFLFTDGEEFGWKGASSFINGNLNGKDEIGVVLCFDAVPGNAPLVLAQTSPGDAWLVRNLTILPLRLVGGSWTNLHERSDNDTDFELFQTAGYTGIELENEPSGTRYQTMADTVNVISPGLVQAYGQTMMALANRFGSIDLRARFKGPDVTYFTLPFVGLVAYPDWLMLGLSGVGLLALLAFLVLALRQARFRPWLFLLSLLGLSATIGILVLGAHYVWGLIQKAYANQMTANGYFEASTFWQAALMMGVFILMAVSLAFLVRYLGGVNLAGAAVLIYLGVGFLFYKLAGGGNPLISAWLAWPFLGCITGMGILLFVKNRVWKTLLLLCSAFLTLALMVPQLWLGAYTREDAWILALIVAAWSGLFAPQVDGIFGNALKPR